ncbi:hypothetical protein [Spongiivirga citrea]|uniref:Uncharacterized protein n=1 Tax=Spongiivirga citrea TaxID=1481457 RepID=A0A6M0CDP1_9FLAO|nr:hypothetical protein [Spongiivirga citrea]NER15925.1 hypothetical protein [Spongiivirga citrea]
MKLSYSCDSCKKENSYKTNASDRVDLQMRLGKDEIKEHCNNCGHFNAKHLNRLIAVPNKMFMFIGGLIGLIIALYILFRFGILGALAFSLPIMVIAQHKKSVSSFNKTMIRRK